jgi:nucleoside-diphosphate-sugar epimerase
MKVLVAGGAGFIGSHLCEELIRQGDEIICVDSLLTGSKDNLKNLLGEQKFCFLQHDVIQPLKGDLKIDQIYHLASPASPVDYREHSIETLLVNSIGTYHLLELAKKNTAKFLLASTSECYGDPLEHPQKETYWGNVNPIGPRSCYDESKRFAESMTVEYVRKFDLDARIIRIFNTFGPRMRQNDGRVVPNFLKQAKNGEPLTVYGDGSQTRSFCFVSDLVAGIVKAVNTQETKGEVFNLGNPEEHTILEFAKLIKDLTGSDSRIIFEPLPEDDPKQRKPDITKARKILGWEPKVSLQEALKKTIRALPKIEVVNS